MYRKLLISGATVTAATLGLTTPAFAQDCFNASRGTTGNAAAATAGTWWSIPEVLADLGGLTPAQIAVVMPVIQADSRIPANFTVFYNPAHPGELASSMNPKNADNGRGIDHSDDYATPVFAAIFEDVAVALS